MLVSVVVASVASVSESAVNFEFVKDSVNLGFAENAGPELPAAQDRFFSKRIGRFAVYKACGSIVARMHGVLR